MPAGAERSPVLGAPARLLAELRSDLAHPVRWPAFEGLRGVAAVAVVGYHLLRLLAPSGPWREALPQPLWWLAGGRLGVDVFFVLSGMLVVQSWESIRRQPTSFVARSLGFARRRLVRVMPAYLVSLVVLVPLVAPELLDVARWSDLALLATAQGYWRPGLIGEVNVVYWTLTTETCFYVLAGVTALLVRRWGTGVLLWLGAAVLATLWVHGDVPDLRGDLPPGHLGGRLDQFVIGALAGHWLLRDAGGRGRLAVERLLRSGWFGWLLGGAVLAMAQWHGSFVFRGGPRSWSESAFHPAFAVLVALVVVRLAERPPRWASSSLARGSGQVSYSLYLWHYPILVLALRSADLTGEGFAVGPDGAAAIVAALVAITAVTALSYSAVERWAIRARHRRPAVARSAAP